MPRLRIEHNHPLPFKIVEGRVEQSIIGQCRGNIPFITSIILEDRNEVYRYRGCARLDKNEYIRIYLPDLPKGGGERAEEHVRIIEVLDNFLNKEVKTTFITVEERVVVDKGLNRNRK